MKRLKSDRKTDKANESDFASSYRQTKRHTAWQTVPIEQKIEGKCYSVCLSELSVPACSDLQTNHRVKLGFLCACVFVCVRACASMFAWGGGGNT